MKTIALILLGCLFNEVSAGMLGPLFPSCLEANTTYNQDNLINTIPNVEKPEDCQDLCTENCKGFTWMAQDSPIIPKFCLTFSNVGEEVPCQHCVSGPPTCTGSCYLDGECQVDDNVLDVHINVPDIDSCINICAQNPYCKFITYFNDISPQQHFCTLYTSCNHVDNSCAGCITSPKICEHCDFEDTVDGGCKKECRGNSTMFGDNCYTVLKYTDFFDRRDCRYKCGQLGGDIASIHSQEENEFLVHLEDVANDWPYLAYIGANCTSGACEWLDNTPFDFQAWEQNYPKYYTDTCVGLYKNDHQWRDSYDCDSSNIDCICKHQLE